MLDLTGYSNEELALHVFNEQYFYSEIGNVDYLVALCREEFFFTDAQLNELLEQVAEANEFDGVE